MIGIISMENTTDNKRIAECIYYDCKFVLEHIPYFIECYVRISLNMLFFKFFC